MDTNVVTAMAAVMGSLVGGAATIATAWLTQRTQTRRQLIDAEIAKREQLYAQFIAECSALAIDSLDHSLDGTSKFLNVYALQNRMRLISSAEVVEAADGVVKRIIRQYSDRNYTLEQMRELVLTSNDDPLRPFGEAGRRELAALQRRGTL